MNHRLHVVWYGSLSGAGTWEAEVSADDGGNWDPLFDSETGNDWLGELEDPDPGIYRVRMRQVLVGTCNTVTSEWVEAPSFIVNEEELVAYRLRIRNADDDGDELVLSSLPGYGNLCLLDFPRGDGEEFNPITGESTVGAYVVPATDRLSDGATPAYVITEVLHDEAARQQLLSRRAMLEETRDGGATWQNIINGFLNRLALSGGLSWSFTVGESRRVERRRKVFEQVTDGFLNPTVLIGEPMRQAWGPTEILPTAWRCTVTDVTGDLVTLQFSRGWGTDDSGVGGRTLLTTAAVANIQRANNLAAPELVPTTVGRGRFPGIAVEIVGSSTRYTPVSQADGLLVGAEGEFTLEWATSQPSEGDEFDVFGWRKTIDEASPLHIYAHPVDIVTTIWDELGLAWNASAAAVTKNTLGPSLRALLRITQSYETDEFITMLAGLVGFAVRFNDDGERELFSTRVRGISVPSTTVTLDEMRSIDAPVFEVDEDSLVTRVIIRQQSFVLWNASMPMARPADYIGTFDKVPLEYEVDDIDVYGEHEQIYELPGSIVVAPGGVTYGEEAFEYGVARELLDRFGRGASYTTLPVTRDIDVAIGEELILDLDHYPIASGRGGLRVVQVVRRELVPGGYDLRVMDTGDEAQPATTPTFTISQSATDVRKIASVEITNAATLNAAGIRVNLEWDFGGATPDGGSIVATYAPGDIPTAPFDLPPVDAGTVVYLRMQSLQKDRRAGAYTAWDSVALDALQPPTDLDVVASAGGDDSLADLSFTAVETDMPHEVYQRLQSESASANVLLALLPPGVDHFSLLNVSLSESYTFTVRAVEYAPFKGVSSSVTKNFTAGASGGVLAYPAHVAAEIVEYRRYTETQGVLFAPGKSSVRAYCLADADAFAQGARVRFWIAYESAPGSGVFSDPEVFATVDSVGPSRAYTVSPWLLVPNPGPRGFAALICLGYSHIRADGLESAVNIDTSMGLYTEDPSVAQPPPPPLTVTTGSDGPAYFASGTLTSEAQTNVARGGTGANLSATGPGLASQASSGAAITVGTSLPAGTYTWTADTVHRPSVDNDAGNTIGDATHRWYGGYFGTEVIVGPSIAAGLTCPLVSVATAGVSQAMVKLDAAGNFVGYRLNTSLTSPTAPANGDALAFIGGGGYEGAYIASSRIRIVAAEDWSGSGHGASINLQTTKAGSTASPGNRWTVDATTTSGGDLIPATDNLYNLASSAARLATAYSYVGDFTGPVYSGGATSSKKPTQNVTLPANSCLVIGGEYTIDSGIDVTVPSTSTLLVVNC